MDYVVMLLTVAAFTVGGIIIGIIIGTDRMKESIEKGSVGHLRIDRSEEDEAPRAFLEIVGTTIEGISKKEFVILKVVNENYISRD